MLGFTMARPLTGLPKGSAEKSPLRMASEGTRPVKVIPFALILLLAIHEEKRLVVADGPSDRAAKLVQIELRGCRVKVALRVEVGVADKLESDP
jgi:hypothetical protein